MKKFRTVLITVPCETFPDHTDEEFDQWLVQRLRAQNLEIFSQQYPNHPLVLERLNADIEAYDENIRDVYVDEYRREEDEMRRLRFEGRYGQPL